MPDGRRVSFAKPSLESFIFEGEATPWLLRRRVVASIIAAFVLLALAYVVTSEALGISYEIDPEPFQSWVRAQGALGPVVYIAILALSVLIAPIPNGPIFIAAGLAWGAILGTAYSMAGMLLGSSLAFWIARWAGRRYLARLIGSRAAYRVDDAALLVGGKVIFWARLLPVINFDWVSFLAGLTAMQFRTFFLWSTAGMVLPTALMVAAGDGLGRDVRITLAAGGIWAAGIVLTALYFGWRYQHKRAVPVLTSADPGIGEQPADDQGLS